MSSLRKDLSSISSLTEESIQKVAEIASNDVSANIEWVLYLDALNEEDKEASAALFRLLNYIGDAFADCRDFKKETSELDSFITRLAGSNENAISGWNKLKASYPILQEFFISKKEETIKSRFSKADELSITVDARPVFSLDRTSIEKVLYPFILKIDTCDEKSFLCELHQEQIELLEEEIKFAKQKQNILTRAIES